MTVSHHHTGDDRDPELDAALGELLTALESHGDDPAAVLEAVIQRFPQFAADLREFCSNHLAMRGHDDERAEDTDLLGPSAKTTFFDSQSQGSVKAAAAPAVLGKYELGEELGRGGMGVVVRGKDPNLGQQVAIKMLQAPPSDHSAVQRFYAEAQATAKLSHSGIVSVFEVGEHAGQHYYVMELLAGKTLAEVVQNEGPAPARQAAMMLRQAAIAVEHAHQHGVIHRDLKPANIILDEQGEPKLVDFGLAKRHDADLNLTRTGQIVGTLAFMAPEQASGRTREITEAVDIYGLGTVLYTALTGRPPFEAESQAEVIVKVLTADPLTPSLPRAERDLGKICMKCLEKSPQRRYASAQALADDLDCFLRGEPVAAAAHGVQRIQKWLRQRPSLAAHIGVLTTIETLRHVKSLWGGGEANDLHISMLIGAWILLCLVFQSLVRRFGDSLRMAWSLTDVVMLTGALILVANPHGPLLAAYPLLIACCALLFRVRLVVMTTIGAILGYAVLLAVRPSGDPPHYHLLFVLMLASFGVIVGAHLRRLRILAEH